MKKGILPLLLAMLFLLAAGCSNGETETASNLDPQNPVTITLWHYYVGENQQALESAVNQFNQTIGLENGIVVEAVAKGSIAELEQAITNSAKGVINADPMPDVFSSYPDKAMEIDAFGKITDLNAYFTPEEKQLYVEGFLADGIFDNERFLLVPIVKSTELFYVNATVWHAFAADMDITEAALTTWEGVYETAKAYFAWSGGKALIGFDSVANYIIIGNKQQGVEVIDTNNKQVLLDHTALRKIFDIYYNGMVLGYYDAEGKFRSDDIKTGVLISYVGSSSSAAYFPTWIAEDNQQTSIDFLALPYPVFQAGQPYAIQQGAGMCVANNGPTQEEGAAIFLKWFTAPEQNIDFAMTTGYLPVQQQAYGSAQFTEVLAELRQGEAAAQNVAAVYEIALHQITESSTYSAKPFAGSYDVRSIMQSTLINTAAEDMEQGRKLKEQGLADEEILSQLNADSRFTAWLNIIKTQLTEFEIKYTEQ